VVTSDGDSIKNSHNGPWQWEPDILKQVRGVVVNELPSSICCCELSSNLVAMLDLPNEMLSIAEFLYLASCCDVVQPGECS
jgi:hypothetical protein